MEPGAGFCGSGKIEGGNLCRTHHTVPMTMGPRNKGTYIDFKGPRLPSVFCFHLDL